MESAYFEKLKQDLQCSLCNNTLTEPKLLQCFHTFCKSCIQKHAQLQKQVHIFKCPTCSSETSFQELSNVEDLQPSPLHSRMLQVLEYSESEKCCSVSETHSPALWQCLDCDQSLCDECLKCHAKFTTGHRVVSLSEVKKEDLELILTTKAPCKAHSNNIVELFCKDCDVLVCSLCLKDDHKDHKALTLQEFIAFQKDSFTKNLKKMEKLLGNDTEKKQQEEIAIKMISQAEKAKQEVKKITKTLVKRLVNKEKRFLEQIQRSVTRADRNLRLIRHIPAAQEYLKSLIANETANTVDLVHVNNYNYDPYQFDTEGIVFNPNQELDKHIADTKLGQTKFTYKSNPILCNIESIGILQVMKPAKLYINTKLSDGSINYDYSDVVDIQISPADNAKVEDKRVKTDGKIEVEFLPRVPGQLKAEVKLNGIPVANSPFAIMVNTEEMEEVYKSKLKTVLNSYSKNFRGIAANNANSRIAVADYSLHCVRVFSMDGQFLLLYSGKGSQQGQLYNPEGLAFLNDTDLVIADSGNNRLCVVNTVTGTLVKTFGCQGNGNGEFSNPHGVHVDDDGNIIVSDTGNGRVQVFTKDGDYQYQFTVPDVENFKPYSTVTHSGLFYVSDWKNAVIHVIQMKDGSVAQQSTIAEKGDNDGQLQEPCGLAIDNDNNLLVCDHKSQSIKKFTLNGRFVGKTQYPRGFDRQKIMFLYVEVLSDGQFICSSKLLDDRQENCFGLRAYNTVFFSCSENNGTVLLYK